MILNEVCAAFNEEAVRYLLIGSAAIAIKAGRLELMGDDVDFLMPNKGDEMNHAASILRALGFSTFTRRGEPVSDMLAMVSRMWATKALRGSDRIDLALLVFECPFEESWAARDAVLFDGVTVFTLPLKRLLSSKRTTDREKDRVWFLNNPWAGDDAAPHKPAA